MTAAIEACDFIVVEWSVPGGAEPSAEAVRALPSAIGRALASAISTHVLAARTLPRGFRRRELDLAVAVRRDGSPHLAEDWDLLLGGPLRRRPLGRARALARLTRGAGSLPHRRRSKARQERVTTMPNTVRVHTNEIDAAPDDYVTDEGFAVEDGGHLWVGGGDACYAPGAWLYAEIIEDAEADAAEPAEG